MSLKPELVPASAFYSNLRAILNSSEWRILRRQVFAEHDHKCQICGKTGLDQGRSHKVECHEVWGYHIIEAEPWRGYQVLEDLQCLCPMCHAVKHIGFQMTLGQKAYLRTLQHMTRINNVTVLDSAVVVMEAFEKHTEMSKIQWELDLTVINHFLTKYGLPERKELTNGKL